MSLSAKAIRETYLSFFEARSHHRVPSAPLVPQDPTLLFVNAGMVPFKRLLSGEQPAPWKRAVSSQKVLRVSGKHNDLEEVGPSNRHHTFFEMLGNFSFGDYFKQEAIGLAWELLTEHFGFEMKDLVVSVFHEDDESAKIWEQEVGFPPEKIYRLGEAENFWTMGDTGPCGPCTEIHLDRGPLPDFPDDDPSSSSGRFLEFWNLVFMQFVRDASGNMTPLPKPSVDTGLGLERLAQILQGKQNNYETDLFTPLLARAQELCPAPGVSAEQREVALRVVADHARAVAFLLGDGVLPANEGRGYVLRRILRRASRYGVLLGRETPFLHAVVEGVTYEMGDAFPELSERRAYIIEHTRREEERFLQTLTRGLALLEGEVEALKARGESVLPAESAFRLYDTYGFPLDLTRDILKEHGLSTSDEGFRLEMEGQRTRSRAAWAGSGDSDVDELYSRIARDISTEFTGYDTLTGEAELRVILQGGAPVEGADPGARVEVVFSETPFYPEGGGQVGDRGVIRTPSGRIEVEDTQKKPGDLVVHRGVVSEGPVRSGDVARLEVDAAARAATVRNHSGTHLLHAALRRVLGEQALQKGSLVAPDRLRFDFTYDAALSEAQLVEIEDLVNGWVQENRPAAVEHKGYNDAVAGGAVAIFDEKYGDDVRVVKFGDFSNELCGGTHVRATGDIGLLTIVSQSAVAAGVRRVEALTGQGALRHLRTQQRTLQEAAEQLKAPPSEVVQRIERLLEERRSTEKELAQLRRRAAAGSAAGGEAPAVRDVAGVKVLVHRSEGLSGKELRGVVDDLRARLGSGVVLATAVDAGRVSLALGLTPDLSGRLSAGELVQELAGVVGGRGGGRADFAQAGGDAPEKLDAAVQRLHELVEQSAG